MAQPPRPERDDAKAGAGESSAEPGTSGQDAMDRFRALTKRLLSVSHEELVERETLRGRKPGAERKN